MVDNNEGYLSNNNNEYSKFYMSRFQKNIFDNYTQNIRKRANEMFKFYEKEIDETPVGRAKSSQINFRQNMYNHIYKNSILKNNINTSNCGINYNKKVKFNDSTNFLISEIELSDENFDLHSSCIKTNISSKPEDKKKIPLHKKKSSKSLNGIKNFYRIKKKKRVNFSRNFVTIINVESYKKYNSENTCRDPFNQKADLKCTCIIF